MGEFQELLFEVRMSFRQALDEPAYDAFLDVFIDLIESGRLAVGAFGGSLPLLETKGFVMGGGRASPSEDDRQSVLAWLNGRPEVLSAEAGALVDAWYGSEDAS